MLISIIAVFFTFGIVIFLHEFGHFIVAKLSKIYVEAFSFGFGKELWGFTKAETRYSIRLIPLGGYVKPKGEDIDEYKGEPDEYFSKPWYTRLAIVLAGPFMNYVLAFIVFFFVIFFVGQPVPTSKAIIGDVAPNYPAEVAGLKEGDKILSINSINVDSWKDMSQIIHENPGKELEITYERDGSKIKTKITATKSPLDSKMGIIGIAPLTEYKGVSFFKAISMSIYQCYFWTAFTVENLAKTIYRMEKPDVSGPIGIVNIVSKAAHSGFSDYFFLLGLISIAVGFFNLLPIPLLDGGHAFLYIFEGISKKKLNSNIMKYVNSTGMAFLLMILVFATYNDIMRIYNSKASQKKVAQEIQKTADK
jgi:regulator of sigma E protease